MKITESEYHEAENNYLGYCPKCDALTREMTEPDAEGYDCPECGENTVQGVMTALLEGGFQFE